MTKKMTRTEAAAYLNLLADRGLVSKDAIKEDVARLTRVQDRVLSIRDVATGEVVRIRWTHDGVQWTGTFEKGAKRDLPTLTSVAAVQEWMRATYHGSV